MSEKSKSKDVQSRAMHALQELGKKSKKLLKKAHSTLGMYGWISIVLAFLLLGTLVHNEERMNRFGYNTFYEKEFRPARMMDDAWNRDINENFTRMQNQMNEIRATNEKALKGITTPAFTAIA
jgi:hypothetical protein